MSTHNAKIFFLGIPTDPFGHRPSLAELCDRPGPVLTLLLVTARRPTYLKRLLTEVGFRTPVAIYRCYYPICFGVPIRSSSESGF